MSNVIAFKPLAEQPYEVRQRVRRAVGTRSTTAPLDDAMNAWLAWWGLWFI